MVSSKKSYTNDDLLLPNMELENRLYPVDSPAAHYGTYLKSISVEFEECGHYLKIGDINHTEAQWILHLSVIRQAVKPFLHAILPFLAEQKVSFIIAADPNVHTMILDGGLGYDQVGKVVSIFPGPDHIADIAGNLSILTARFNGPVVPAAQHLAGCVYTSYGNLSNILQHHDGPSLKEKDWPFKGGYKYRRMKNIKWINEKYLVIHSLKNDVKGSVFKCIYFKSLLDMRYVIVKQGKNHQCTDDYGRNIKDRLQWQYQVHRLLSGKISLPKVYDYFEVNGDGYLSMEMIEGVSLNEKISLLQQGTCWEYLDVNHKRELLGYLLQIVKIISDFHQNGFLHRDINPGNFLINENGGVIAIDIELCYDLNADSPHPEYTLGTPGYMSPQQARVQQPDIKDDSYGLGALLIKTFTGLSPYKFNTGTPELLHRNLQFLIGNNAISALICGCLNDDAGSRPRLESIRHALEVYDSVLVTNINNKAQLLEIPVSVTPIKDALQKAIKSLGNGLMTGNDDEWLSKSKNTEGMIANEVKSYCWYPGVYAGSSGVLYVIATAEQAGFDTFGFKDVIFKNCGYLEKYFEFQSNTDPGFYHGSAGYARTLCMMTHAGLLEDNIFNTNRIYKLVSRQNKLLNLSSGIAGQGLCLLNCQKIMLFPSIHDNLHNLVKELLGQQRNDGSWTIKKDERQDNGIKLTGLSHGIAGITYFLIAAYALFECPDLKKAILKSLHWLIKQRKLINGHFIWQVNTKNSTIDPWLEYGFSGIALTFIKAFEVFHDPLYKVVATSALLSHPPYISSNYLSLANGLSGLGEVYLEAFKIFKEQQWKDRAAHIAELLLNTYKVQNDDVIYWLEGNDTKPSSDLMTGNSGIIHFLIRHCYPEKIGFPLLLKS
jgi:serine/threonine protein kinase